VKGKDRELWINTGRTKSKIEANVSLLPQAAEIVEKYKNILIALQTTSTFL
jgi:hypothetical protein